jgi:alkylhydroperoxidase/carboxymuconolactone decarboxylase family protein YurZ
MKGNSMVPTRPKRRLRLVTALAGLAFITAAPAGVAAQANGQPCAQVASEDGTALPLLALARRDCPALAAIIEEYAAIDLGEAFPQEAAAIPSPELALAARYAALGDVRALTRYARRASVAGAKQDDLRELIYVTAVSAGLQKAMQAARALDALVTALPVALAASRREGCMHSSAEASILEN